MDRKLLWFYHISSRKNWGRLELKQGNLIMFYIERVPSNDNKHFRLVHELDCLKRGEVFHKTVEEAKEEAQRICDVFITEMKEE